MKKVDILAIGVHPDDVELSCAGTLLKHMQMGYSVAILDLTHGELGTRGSGPLRLQEAVEAAAILKIADRVNIGIPDGFFENNELNKRKIIEVVRTFRPEIVLANAVEDRHPDHGRSAELIYDACFLAGLSKVQTMSSTGEQQSKWRPRVIYNYVQDKMLLADLIVDITPYIDQKMESIMAYRSQFYDANSTEDESPISGKDFLDYIRARAQSYGRQIGVEYGEGFTASRPLGVEDLLKLR